MKLSKILIADDHDLMRQTIQSFLCQKGFVKVFTASNGIEALQAIETEKPDLALIDNQMPDLSGLQVAAECYLRKLSVKLVLISFDSSINSKEKLNDCHLQGYLLKDSLMEELEMCIETVLNDQIYLCRKIKPQPSWSSLTSSEKKTLHFLSQTNDENKLAQKLMLPPDELQHMLRTLEKKLSISAHTLNEWVKNNPPKL